VWHELQGTKVASLVARELLLRHIANISNPPFVFRQIQLCASRRTVGAVAVTSPSFSARTWLLVDPQAVAFPGGLRFQARLVGPEGEAAVEEHSWLLEGLAVVEEEVATPLWVVVEQTGRC
jgi:hypothetical protein